MTTVGILGGGQLARMLALAGAPLGLRFLIVDSADEPCAGQVAPLVRADWRDGAALADFARRVDVATFDFENVPADTAHRLTEHTQVFPNPRALAVSQDRLDEKNLFRQIGLATPEFAAVDSREDLLAAIDVIGLPAVLKTRRLGYDGKGQALLRSRKDAETAWQVLGATPLILEAFVPFEREVSLIAVRSRSGEFRHYPLTHNWHDNGILAVSLAPAADTIGLERDAVVHARALAERLDYVGTFALELFAANGRLLGNEIAPRVHNSGHWTIEGAHCSQFENHLRAVLGWPLGETAARGCSVMLNFVGALPEAAAVLSTPGAHWHDYGKSARAGRKVGHATICADDRATLADRVESIALTLDRGAQLAAVVAALRAAG